MWVEAFITVLDSGICMEGLGVYIVGNCRISIPRKCW